MALDDLLISTGVDQLIKLVSQQGKVEIGFAAKELGQPIRTIEDWAHVLEGEGLIRVEYKLTKIFLVWAAPSREYVAEKSGKIGQKAIQAKQEIASLEAKVETGGAELAKMQGELAQLESAQSFSPQDAERLKAELTSLEEKYNSSFETALKKMAALEKKLADAKPKIDEAGKKSGTKADADFAGELATLSKFESTLRSQLEETDTFFEAFQTRLEEFRKRVEEGKTDEKIEELKNDLSSVRALRAEIMGAVEAIEDEQKSVDEKLSGAEKKLSELVKREDSVMGAKKKLTEVRRLAEDARKQKKNIGGQLSDTLSLVKKQMAKIRELGDRQQEAKGEMQRLKDDYVDISEEISRANEELSARQKDISGRIAQQMRALESAGKGRISRDEIERVSFLFNELKSEQARMEQGLKVLSKETEILKLEADSAKEGMPRMQMAAAASRGAGIRPGIAGTAGRVIAGAGAKPGAGSEEEAVAFVDKIKLTEEEEGDFEQKRNELRSLIRKMWEENKGGS